jgi:hypothetical protein
MKYAYFLSENRETDCYSISFECIGQTKIQFFGWDFNFNLCNIHYLVIDDTRGGGPTMNWKYQGCGVISYSEYIEHFKFKVVHEDIDRKILTIEITEKIENFDIRNFKRDIRIDKLLEI